MIAHLVQSFGGPGRGTVRLSGPGFLLGVPVAGGLFTLVTAVILARVGGRLLGIRLQASPLPTPIRSLRQRADRSWRYLHVTRLAARARRAPPAAARHGRAPTWAGAGPATVSRACWPATSGPRWTRRAASSSSSARRLGAARAPRPGGYRSPADRDSPLPSGSGALEA